MYNLLTKNFIGSIAFHDVKSDKLSSYWASTQENLSLGVCVITQNDDE